MSAVPQNPAASLPVWSREGREAGAGERARRAAAKARARGLVQGAVGAGAAVLLWLLWRTPFAYLVAAIALAVALLAAASPLGGYARLSGALETFGRWVGTAVTWLLMTLLFYLLFLPFGALLRARRRLRLTTGFDPAAATYWTSPGAGREGRPRGPEAYRQQF